MSSGHRKVKEAVEVYEELHKTVDTWISKIGANNLGTPTCLQGCAHCCREIVVMTLPEALYIIYTRITSIRSLKTLEEKVQKQLWKIKDRGILTAEQWRDYELDCVFLSEDKRCKIYASRPVVCRALIVFDPSTVCSSQFKTPRKALDSSSVINLDTGVARECARDLRIPAHPLPLPLAMNLAIYCAANGLYKLRDFVRNGSAYKDAHEPTKID